MQGLKLIHVGKRSPNSIWVLSDYKLENIPRGPRAPANTAYIQIKPVYTGRHNSDSEVILYGATLYDNWTFLSQKRGA